MERAESLQRYSAVYNNRFYREVRSQIERELCDYDESDIVYVMNAITDAATDVCGLYAYSRIENIRSTLKIYSLSKQTRAIIEVYLRCFRVAGDSSEYILWRL